MDKLIALCKGRGFIFAGSEIYGGLANSWDYGPLGVELKNNIKAAWYKKFVTQHKDNIGLDSSIIGNPNIWKSSGHLDGFSDPLMDCKSCKTRHRADSIVQNYASKKSKKISANMCDSELEQFIVDNKIACPNCGKSDFTPIRKFNLMFKTYVGPSQDSASTVYLRPETSQGIFINFKNLLRTNRNKMPFGVGQIGKSFRNEITPGNYIFRTREFEQMELEFFCEPGTDGEWFNYWKNFCVKWLSDLGISHDNMRVRDHQQSELSHYSSATSDIEFNFPFGWNELWGIANRTDFDLKAHSNETNELTYQDSITHKKYVPYIIEPSLGLDRVLLAFLCNGYTEEPLQKDNRLVLKLHPILAPYKVAVLPLQKDQQILQKSNELYTLLNSQFTITYDDTASIGKRYRRQDEIGTPMCVTIDFETLENNTVTIRDRDTMAQQRLGIHQLLEYIQNKVKF
jgi:glycyl-tRNA synthetase